MRTWNCADTKLKNMDFLKSPEYNISRPTVGLLILYSGRVNNNMRERTRKQEFLDAAFDLFHEKGYEQTTVNDIINKLNASKGGFYHYFKSKEDVLEAVAQHHIEEEISTTQEIAEDNGLKAIEKINGIINIVLIQKAHNLDKRQEISKLFEHEGNIRFLRKIAENKIRALSVPYMAVLEQGIREGAFDISFPEETAELVINMCINLNSKVTRLAAGIKEKPESIGLVKRKLDAFSEAVERLLGTEKGTVNLSEAIEIFEKFV